MTPKSPSAQNAEPDYMAALKASDLVSESGVTQDVMRKLTPHICHAFGAYGWGLLLTGDPLPQFDVFVQTNIGDAEMAKISTGAMVIYNEFSELGSQHRAKVHAVNRSKSKCAGADIIMAWQMFVPSGFLGVTFLIGDGQKVPSVQEIRIFSLLANQLGAAIESSRMHQQVLSEVTMDSAEGEDAATGLPGRKHFMRDLAHEFRRSARYGHDLSCLFIDLSCLGTIKRTHSAEVHDRLLGQVARALRRTIREVDVAARYGASQFAIILPDTNVEGARFVAQRFLFAVEDLQVSSRSKPGPCLRDCDVRICIGQAKRSEDTAKGLVARIRSALDRAKKKGSRDSVITAPMRASSRKAKK